METKTAQLNQGDLEFRRLLKYRYQQIYGAVAWPGKNPGFAVVVGKSHESHFNNYDVYLIEEFEHFDTRQLVRKCCVMDYNYKPDRWIGDNKSEAGDRFIRKMNSELGPSRRKFGLTKTRLLDMDYPYTLICPELKALLDENRRQLFLKDSKVTEYLMLIEPSEISVMKQGEYPAIEALGFAVIELRDSEQTDLTLEQIKELQERYGYR